MVALVHSDIVVVIVGYCSKGLNADLPWRSRYSLVAGLWAGWRPHWPGFWSKGEDEKKVRLARFSWFGLVKQSFPFS